MSRWRFEESIADLKFKTERKKDRRTRELMHLIYHHNGKIRDRAIKELETMFKLSNLKIFIGQEVEKRLT